MDVRLLINAFELASFAHRFQTRKSDNSSYIVHPVRVANTLVKIGGVVDDVILSAALLHDVVEDTSVTLEEIEKLNPEVAAIVAQVTDNKKLTKVERKKLQVTNASKKCNGAKLVKLADKYDNLSDIVKLPPKGWDKNYILGYFVWSKKVVEGLRGTNVNLEAALDKLFLENIPSDIDLDAELELYYKSL